MFYLALFFSSLVLTYAIKKYALQKSIIDIPNERSSHAVPTPRGGGLAIIVTFFIGLFLLQEEMDTKLFYALLCSLPIVVVSLVDDIISLSSKVRFLVQAVSALMALYFLGGVDSVDFILFEVHGWWLNIFAFFSIVWLTNLYNFLDGIDGYAASEAIAVALGLYLVLNTGLGLVLIASTFGFLIFNWHKASIFMGDVGSATLGFIFAILAFSETSNGTIYFWLIILSIFWVDATITLIRRYRNNEKVTQAHRKHAYQRLTQQGWSHSKVVLYSIFVNAVFLALLYWLPREWWLYLFIANLIVMFFIIKFVDNKKSFNG
ncbi:MAG: glycosyltransferase family 4 protein [Campylobacterales bacterium]|nr:glycosyltransferase family 4 protein [Campylobacterales bacterium]